jgi:hypothetical protein
MVKNKLFLRKKDCKITKNYRKTTLLNRIFRVKKLIFFKKYLLNELFFDCWTKEARQENVKSKK